MKTARTAATLATTLLASALASCGGTGSMADGGDGGGGAISVTIANPMPNSTIMTRGPIGVLIEPVNYMLGGPALCSAGMTHCGQARLTVDGGSCASGNMTGAQLSFDIDLSTCGGMLTNHSSHSVTVVLLDGSGNPISGATATANFTVLTM